MGTMTTDKTSLGVKIKAKDKPCRWCGVNPRAVLPSKVDCYCRPCRNAYTRERFKTRPPRKDRKEYLRMLRRTGNAKHAARGRRGAAVQRLRHPEKVAARVELSRAVKSGAVIKPKECERCHLAPSRIEGHHHQGYDKPLVVQWLCVGCHRLAHGFVPGMKPHDALKKELRGKDVNS